MGDPLGAIASPARRFTHGEVIVRQDDHLAALGLYDFYQAGDITAAQIKAAFGLSVAQWLTFRDKVIEYRTHWLAIQEAQGE